MQNQSKIKVGIVGVSGYGGGELARLLLQHPFVHLTYVTSNTYAGQKLSASFAGMSKKTDLVCETYDTQKAIALCDILFLAGEAGLAMKVAPELLAAGKKIIDLSADFRLKNVADFKQWYKMEHTATEALKAAVYGLPELYRDQIQKAQLIANPGCYPTSCVLSLMPLIKAGWIDLKSVIIDSYSGVSGAGRSKFCLDFHFAEVNESLKPYAAGGVHRHVPEIEQVLTEIAGQPVMVTFTPHLAPVTRGILTTVYANLVTDKKDATFAQIHALYEAAYGREQCVVVLEEGQYPATKHVVGSNACHIGLALDARTKRVIVFAAEDNLVKGMTGQAIQNMNLMCGFDEMSGVSGAGLWP